LFVVGRVYECGIVVDVSERVQRRVRVDFPHQADRVIGSLTGLTHGVFPGEARDSIAVERVQVAALVVAQGNLRRLDEAVALGRTDWRDLLVAAGLADEDWQDQLEVELAPASATHIWIVHRQRPPI
jgi:hypothetical protein